ncbi:MAG: hypothetical protein GY953_55780, partial [bacterium]|nr:hypothetical protein [bacterium]
LVLLLQAAPRQAAEAAQQLADNPDLDDQFHRDAYQILLAAQSPSAAKKMAAAALSSEDAEQRKMAILYLAGGSSAIRQLRGYISLSINGDDGWDRYGSSGSNGQPIIPEPPKGLQVEQVRPLLADPDPRTAAYAGYLLALFDDPSGMEKLLQFWRKRKDPDAVVDVDQLDWLTYRAIAVLNNPRHLP